MRWRIAPGYSTLSPCFKIRRGPENPPGGGSFARGRRWLVPYSPLRALRAATAPWPRPKFLAAGPHGVFKQALISVSSPEKKIATFVSGRAGDCVSESGGLKKLDSRRSWPNPANSLQRTPVKAAMNLETALRLTADFAESTDRRLCPPASGTANMRIAK